MYRLICQKPAHLLSAQMAFVSTFFQMFTILQALSTYLAEYSPPEYLGCITLASMQQRRKENMIICLQLSIADMPVAIKMNRFIYGAHDGLKIFLNSLLNFHIHDLSLFRYFTSYKNWKYLSCELVGMNSMFFSFSFLVLATKLQKYENIK